MPDLLERWTREQVLALPDDGNRYELVDGALLVTPGPRALHQVAILELVRRLDPFVREHRVGLIGVAPCDLDLGSGQLVQPDLFVVPHPPGFRPREWSDYGIPSMVAEVLSPSTARYDRVVKRALYQRAGVGEYWIVDPDARLVERWRPEDTRPAVIDGELRWAPVGAPVPLRLDLPGFFREIHAEP